MKRSLLAIALLLAVGFAAIPSTNAQNCDTPAFVKDLIKKLKDECKKLEGPEAETSKCTSKRARFLELVQKWNTLVGNSPLHLGPRDMECGDLSPLLFESKSADESWHSKICVFHAHRRKSL